MLPEVVVSRGPSRASWDGVPANGNVTRDSLPGVLLRCLSSTTTEAEAALSWSMKRVTVLGALNASAEASGGCGDGADADDALQVPVVVAIELTCR